MLSKQDDGRRRVAGTSRDMAPSHDGGSMIGFLLVNGRSGGATRGSGEWCVFMLEGSKVVAPT
jgi:hypothetical protein